MALQPGRYYAKRTMYLPGEVRAAALKGELVIVSEFFREDETLWADCTVNLRRLTIPAEDLMPEPDPSTPPSYALDASAGGHIW